MSLSLSESETTMGSRKSSSGSLPSASLRSRSTRFSKSGSRAKAVEGSRSITGLATGIGVVVDSGKALLVLPAAAGVTVLEVMSTLGEILVGLTVSSVKVELVAPVVVVVLVEVVTGTIVVVLVLVVVVDGLAVVVLAVLVPSSLVVEVVLVDLLVVVVVAPCLVS